jgi:hypothetical protein
MQVTVEEARAVMGGLGFRTAGKWDLVRLTRRINQLNAQVSDDTVIGDNVLDNMLDEILAELRDGKEVEVIESADSKPDDDWDIDDEEEDSQEEEPESEEPQGQASPEPCKETPPQPQKRRGRPRKAPSTKEQPNDDSSPKERSGRKHNDGKSRIAIGAKVLLEHGWEKGITEGMVQQADTLYVQSGGKSNLQTAGFYLRQVRSAVLAYQKQQKGA